MYLFVCIIDAFSAYHNIQYTSKCTINALWILKVYQFLEFYLFYVYTRFIAYSFMLFYFVFLVFVRLFESFSFSLFLYHSTIRIRLFFVFISFMLILITNMRMGYETDFPCHTIDEKKTKMQHREIAEFLK